MLAVFATVTVAISAASLVPQLLRSRRTVDGLSPGSVLLTTIVFALWAAYGIGIGDTAQIVNNAFGLVAFLYLGHRIVTAGRDQPVGLRAWHLPAAAALTLTAAAALSTVSGPAAAAAAGTLIGFTTRVPQVRLAFTGDPMWGLDPWALLLGQTTSTLWLIYGLLIGDVAVIVASIVGVALQAILMWYRLPLRRTVASLAGGRLGSPVAALCAPLTLRLPYLDDRQPA